MGIKGKHYAIKINQIEDFPLAYTPRNAILVKAKAAGSLVMEKE